MADDSNLIEFSLHDTDTASSKSESVKSETVSTKNVASIDSQLEHHIDAIIANVTRKGLSAPATSLLTTYWKPVLAQCASEHGLDSFDWRDTIKKITNLAIYLDPEVKKNYPNVVTKLLPALLKAMEQDIVECNLADSGLTALLEGIQDPSAARPTETTVAKAAATVTAAEQTAPSVTSESLQDSDASLASSLDFNLSDQASIPEHTLDENDDFDLDLSLDDMDESAEELDVLELELPEEPTSTQVDLPEEKASVQSSNKPADIDELPPLDLEPFKDDK